MPAALALKLHRKQLKTGSSAPQLLLNDADITSLGLPDVVRKAKKAGAKFERMPVELHDAEYAAAHALLGLESDDTPSLWGFSIAKAGGDEELIEALQSIVLVLCDEDVGGAASSGSAAAAATSVGGGAAAVGDKRKHPCGGAGDAK